MTNESDSKKKVSKFIRFTTVGMQMAGIIAFFCWLGYFLDKKYNSKTPWWTVGLSLFGVLTSLYLVIREVINISKEGE
jgi:F0F1-type ATP synthase assembly protein I